MEAPRLGEKVEMRYRISQPTPPNRPMRKDRLMNFARDYVDRAPKTRRALVELREDGSRREWSFGEVSLESERVSCRLSSLGVRRGDVVMTLLGNSSEWILTMLACFRIGAVAFSCSELVRAKDIELRLKASCPRLIISNEGNLAELSAAAPDCPVVVVGQDPLSEEGEAEAVDLNPNDPCLITFTSGTAGEPKGALHSQSYLYGQHVQAEHWLSARPDELVWCTASAGWSKSARNAFIAPWLRGAAAVVHDGRFHPDERMAHVEREGVNVLCMAPTEYRFIANRFDLKPLPGLRTIVAAGEALNPEVLDSWHDATGLWIRDGYGQTETGQLTGSPPSTEPRPGSMGPPLPGIKLQVVEGELVVDPTTVETFFLGYLGEKPNGALREQPWHTGDLVRQDEDGYLYFQGRGDDLIISSGYRIGPFEVESALSSHKAVVEAAVVAAPDPERGSIVRAVVVLNPEFSPSQALAQELQAHVKQQTAPYKYPRVVDFVSALPKTASGKIKRRDL